MRRNRRTATRSRTLPLVLGMLSAATVGLATMGGRPALGQVQVELPPPSPAPAPGAPSPSPFPPDFPAAPTPPRPLPADEPPQVVTTSATQTVPPPPPDPKPRDAAPIAAPARSGVLEDPVPTPPVPTPPDAQPARVPSLSPLPAGASTDAASPKITLRLQDENIRKAIELLAGQSSKNLVPSVGVAGQVTLNLKDVSFEQALDALVKLGNLGVRREGEIIYIYSAQELADLDAKLKIPVVRVYCLNYVRAGDISQMIAPFLSKDGTISVTPATDSGIGGNTAAGSNTGLASAGAKLSGGVSGGAGSGLAGGGGVTSGGTSAAGATVSTGADTGGNSLAGGDSMVVRDYAENIAQIDEIVAKIDVQPLQVLIEAVILSVQLDDSQQLGVNFGLVDSMRNVATVSGNGNLINAAAGFTPARVLTTAAAVAPSLVPRPGQLVNGYLGNDQGLKFGFIDKNVSGFVRALETMNKVNILASPRVLVLNKQRAEIQLGQRLGYKNTVTNLTSSLQTVQFLSVGTLLSLRPFVSHDGMVRMELHPEKSTGSLDASGIPQTNTSELTTNILVPDGATIVIGGLIDSTDQSAQQGVLGLSRLPLVGPFFRERVVKSAKTELIVLLTPRVLNRTGLPEPEPGVAPQGPSGLPNSGPMPGPAMFTRAPIELTPFAPTIDGATTPPVPGELAPIVGAKLRDYGWIGGEKPMFDAPVRPASLTATDVEPAPSPESKPKPEEAAAPPPPETTTPEAAPSPVETTAVAPKKPRNPFPPKPSASLPPAVPPEEREIPIDVAAAPPAEIEPRETVAATNQKRGYRPGDLTRGLFERVRSKSEEAAKARSAANYVRHDHDHDHRPARPPLEPGRPPAPPIAERLASHTETVPERPKPSPRREDVDGVANVGRNLHYGWHTVGDGETFATLATRYYGSASLRGALWKVNRHLVPDPEQLAPGTMILIPTTEILDRVVLDGAFATTDAEESPAPARSDPDAPAKKRFRFFGKR